MHLEGFSTRKIAKIMNEKGYITPSVRKKQITNMDYAYNELEYLDTKLS